MKMITIAIKDFIQSTRSLVSVGMMIVAPLLITGLVSLAFGGVSQNGEVTLTDFNVVVTNLDQGSASAPGLGEQIESYLESDQLPTWLKVRSAADEQSARQAVSDQSASAALIIPAGFSQSFFNGSGTASLTLLHDPAAGIGLQIFDSLIDQYLHNVYGTVILSRLAGPSLDGQMTSEYLQYQASLVNGLGAGNNSFLQIDPVGQATAQATQSTNENNPIASLLSKMMAGMMVFFVFFSGANGAQSILREEEQQTMPRLLTTPTSRATVLGGKFLATWLTILVQLAVLVAASSLLFHIDWGNLLDLGLVIFGLSIASTGFGVFLLTFASNTRQAGVLTGGILSVLGMVGGLFTSAIQNIPVAFQTVSLFTPQGWAMRGFTQVLDGASLAATLPAIGMTCLLGIAFFGAGLMRFQRRISAAN